MRSADPTRSQPSPLAALRPAAHFLLLGALLFAADRYLVEPPNASTEPAGVGEITVAAPQVAQLRESWRHRHGRLPTADEERSLVDALVGEQLLVDEALRRGLHRTDLIVHRRLIDKMTFLTEDPGADAGELLRQAFELGLHRDDPIVRRRLILKLRLRVGAGAATEAVTDEELRGYYQRHAERFTEPATVRLSHLFLSRERRPESLETDARRLLAELRAGNVPPERAAELGDPFLLGHHLPQRTAGQLDRAFGAGFADRVAELAPGGWAGPVASAYGLHLVWVHEVVPERPAPLPAVRLQLAEGLRNERREARVAALLEELRQSHTVRIERPEEVS